MCPWCPDANLKLPRLLRAFLKSAAAVQTEGDMLLLGLASHSGWAHLYRLPEFIRAARALGYRVLPPDREFLERAHDHGYVHCSSAQSPKRRRSQGNVGARDLKRASALSSRARRLSVGRCQLGYDA
jgi:hypothetical protein